MLGSISAWWDQSRMQNTVSIIAEGHCPARPITVLCINEIWPYHTQKQTLSFFFFCSCIVCLCAHLVRNVFTPCWWGGLLLFACYQQKIKACSSAWEMPPNWLSQYTHTHTDTHTINDQRSSEKRFASLARILTYSGPAGLGLGPFSCSQCKVGTKI